MKEPRFSCAAKMAVPPVGRAVVLPTRRGASPYTEGCFSLHGGFGFPTRRNGVFAWYVTYLNK